MARPKTSTAKSRKTYIVGISGASGGIYAKRFVETLLAETNCRVDLIATTAGLRVFKGELGGDSDDPPKHQPKNLLDYFDLTVAQRKRVEVLPNGDIGAGPASGTYRAEAMIVIPCSMNTLAGIANGLQPKLIGRAAAVTLKEGRTLIVVPRETPLGLIELRNMTALAEAGGIIMPANPGFYHRPETIEDLADFIVQKVMDRLGIEVTGAFRWGKDG